MIYRLIEREYNTYGNLGLLGELGITRNHAPVAQLDRASDFESAGRPFESDRARQINKT